MDKFDRLDWSLIQAFLAVAENGSLSAAARMLGATQPTLGRQIKAMETQLGADLFHRQARGLSLTDTGAALVEPARRMREAMREISLTVAGQSARLEGSVRITASVAMSIWHLPKLIAKIREEEPKISIDLVPSDKSSNLLYREADIAVRMYRPTQLDLITQHLGHMTIGAYAARRYLDRRGMPRSLDDLMQHDVVGFDEQGDIVSGFAQGGIAVTREWFKTRCDDTATYWALVRAGCGIGFVQHSIGQNDPMVEQVDLGFDLPRLPVWLTAHETMRQTPRIRRVWDILANGLHGIVDAPP